MQKYEIKFYQFYQIVLLHLHKLTSMRNPTIRSPVCLLNLVAQTEVIAERQDSAVHVLHAGWGEDSCVLPDTE